MNFDKTNFIYFKDNVLLYLYIYIYVCLNIYIKYKNILLQKGKKKCCFLLCTTKSTQCL